MWNWVKVIRNQVKSHKCTRQRSLLFLSMTLSGFGRAVAAPCTADDVSKEICSNQINPGFVTKNGGKKHVILNLENALPPSASSHRRPERRYPTLTQSWSTGPLELSVEGPQMVNSEDEEEDD